MVASLFRIATWARRRWWRAAFLVLGLPGGLAGLSWSLTEPLEDSSAPIIDALKSKTPASPAWTDVPPPWPDGSLEGMPAKRLLLATLLAAAERLEHLSGYTAIFRKQERLNDVLVPEQTLAMKVRHRPFAVYLKFLALKEGKEVVYAEGHHENKVITHTPGVVGWLIPRLAVPPDSPQVLAESRHPITEAGLANLTKKLIGFRRMDIADPEAVTILDRTTGPDGRAWLRSLHTHPRQRPERPFARTEVLYDPETRIPMHISNYEWIGPGHEGDLLLAERYAYVDLNLNATLTTLDFDPANPAYAFHR
jgi:hypothetical protein